MALDAFVMEDSTEGWAHDVHFIYTAKRTIMEMTICQRNNYCIDRKCGLLW